MLRTLIKVTCGYPAISDEVGRNSKSIMRMLSPDVDPGVKAFMAVVRAAERQSEKAAARAKYIKSETVTTNRPQWPVFMSAGCAA